MHENRETSEMPAAKLAIGRRAKAQATRPHVRLRGVGPRHITEGSPEQGWVTVGGERGGKAADQGEHFPSGTFPTLSGALRVPPVASVRTSCNAWLLLIRDKSRMR